MTDKEMRSELCVGLGGAGRGAAIQFLAGLHSTSNRFGLETAQWLPTTRTGGLAVGSGADRVAPAGVRQGAVSCAAGVAQQRQEGE